MKLCLIAPLGLLPFANYGDMHFIIPENADRKFWEKEEGYKMFDNGVYESGKPVDTEKLLALADLVRANEIVLPDVIRNEKETLQRTKLFIETTRKLYRYAAVPQAETPEKWVLAYNVMKKIGGIDVLCIPIWLQKRFGCRAAVVNYLIKKGYWSTEHQHHLIGLDGTGELYNYPRGMIRSVDTSLPFSRTECKMLIPFEDSKAPRTPMKLTRHYEISYELLRSNIAALKEVVNTAC